MDNFSMKPPVLDVFETNKKVEVWKNIPGYEGSYQISSFGRVLSLAKYVKHPRAKKGYAIRSQKLLKQTLNDRGYLYVKLYNRNRKKKQFAVHILVAVVFHNHKPNGTHEIVVDHKDENKTNNNEWNIQLITNRENCSKGKSKYNFSSKYTGVDWDRRKKKWRVQMQTNGKSNFLGYFDDEKEASNWYNHNLKRFNNRLEIERKKIVYSSKYKGVSWHDKNKKWIASVNINGKTKHLGTHNNEIDAYNNYLKFIKNGI